MFSLHVALHPSNGKPYFFTFNEQEAWDTVYQSCASICHPDDIFDRTQADVVSYSSWDEMKFVMGEYLSPQENEELYTQRRVSI